MVSHIKGVFPIANRGRGVEHLGGGWGHSKFCPVFDDHSLDLLGLLVLGRGVSMGGSGFPDTSLFRGFLLGGLRVACIVFLALPLLGVIISRPRL